MSIQKASQSTRVLQPTTHTIRPGQVIKGSIVKLYPNNKAEIQLGSQKMVAQLEASLSAGGKYHFMVQSMDPVIRLRVLGEQLQQKKDQPNSLNLLHQLGLKASKRNLAFLQQLILREIPFERVQLEKSFQLLEDSKDKKPTAKLLMEMISNRLPVTKNILQALQAVSQSSLSERLTNILPELDKTDIQPNIRQNVQALIGSQNAITQEQNQLKGEATHNHNLFFLLKLSGVVAPTTGYDMWETKQNADLTPPTTFGYNGKQTIMPLQLSGTQLSNLQHVYENKTILQQNASFY